MTTVEGVMDLVVTEEITMDMVVIEAEAITTDMVVTEAITMDIEDKVKPANLRESELVSREKGAFTGADTRQVGRFEIANGSTLCLDEIGELPLELLAKLLRVIQNSAFERLGSSQTIKVDVRIVDTRWRIEGKGVPAAVLGLNPSTSRPGCISSG
jgi:transcriptional regulator of aromatic amino acid metabolism